MSLSVPQLDVFYIDIAKDENFFKKITKSITGLFDNNWFHIIKSEEELRGYENVNGNSWAINDKSFKVKQYYIRHPKKGKENILIEAKDFYNYIQEEQKDELINFIISHCSASVIRIERAESIEAAGRANGKIDAFDLSGAVSCDQSQRYYYERIDPAGIPRIAPRDNYYWLDKSIMHSIETLTSGTYTDSIERDFTFGLSAQEANIIGLDIDMHKKFSYKIYIECYDNKFEDLKRDYDELLSFQKKIKHKLMVASILGCLGIIIAFVLGIIL